MLAFRLHVFRAMRNIHLTLTVPLLLAALVAPALAGVPTDQLRQRVDEVVRVLDDPGNKGKPAQRRAAVRKISEEIFDYKDTARRTLGPHWTARTPEEQREFVQLFADLLERAYFSRIDRYQGEKVRYGAETINGNEAVVKTMIVTRAGSEVPVDYRMHLADGRWLVYDVNIEGVSLVSNYRTQFNRIVQTESYQTLVQKLRAKDAEPVGDR
jgi:phospholipid transport system substrate-binding protein